ncbi:hypothetical protein HGRIS_001501 [Hohenbuehelia grisea]|uniref:Uncharacterized protein n=1 Tax=Hohenbuehelia grisea TaxID=104357 RepID=A0ABR3JQB9_9AGAR
MDVGEVLAFSHPRYGVAEFFAHLSLLQQNKEEGLSEKMLQWAQGSSAIADAVRVSRPDPPASSRYQAAVPCGDYEALCLAFGIIAQ